MQSTDFPLFLVWDSRLLVDLGGWMGWFGDGEEGVMFGTFCLLPEESGHGMIDCGRLRGPREPHEQHETKTVVGSMEILARFKYEQANLL